MAIKLKTKEERKEISPDIRTALADISARSDARMKLINTPKEKTLPKRRDSSSGSRIQGLASLRNTLGRQYYKSSPSENA